MKNYLTTKEGNMGVWETGGGVTTREGKKKVTTYNK